VIALKALSKQFPDSDMEIDHEREKAVYLALTLLDSMGIWTMQSSTFPPLRN